MIRILTSLVCVCVLAAGLEAQRKREWYRADVWGGPGDAVMRQEAGSGAKGDPIGAEAFTPGNVVVCRIGTGSASLTSDATPVFLDEFTPDGTYVSTVAMPTAASGSNSMLTLSGTSAAECQITLSADGRYIIVPGYEQFPGASGVSNSMGRRVFARVDGLGTVDTTTTTSSFGSSAVRSATSLDGSGIWAVGSGGGVFHFPFGSFTPAATTVSNSVATNRSVRIFGGQLFTSSSAGSYRIGTVGTGTPTGTGNTMTAIPGYPTGDAAVGFFLADLDSGVAGLDTLYVSDEGTGTGRSGGGVKKFSLVAGAWSYNGTFPARVSPAIPATIFSGLTGAVTSPGTVTLFATRGINQGNLLVKFVDSTGYNVAPTATPALLSTAATNTVYRGVVLSPVLPVTSPTVVTTAAADLTSSTATINGSADPNGAATTGYFRFSTTDPGTCNDSFGTRAPATGGTDLGSGRGSSVYSENLTGLTAGTTYYYCAIAQNSVGTSLGSVSSFTTSLPSITINDVSLAEGNAGIKSFSFTVELSAPAGPGGVTFDIATGDGTAQDDNPGTEDEDYVGSSLTGQTIPQGGTSYQLSVWVNGDTQVEPNESFFVNLTSVSGAIVADGQGVGTIENDDADPLNFIITKTADTNDGVCDADCSLREAIANSNINPATDTITFDPALVSTPTTVSLGGTRLDITDNVIITGPGADLLTINANNLSQIYSVGPGIGAEISGMSLTGGNAAGSFQEGGAIYVAGELTLKAVHIYGNYAPLGGAIAGEFDVSIVNIIDSTIANNTAQNVGGVYAYGSANLINSTVSGNNAPGGFVGGLYIYGGTSVPTIKNSTITNNTAASGGGVFSDAPNLQIGGSIIAGNFANDASQDIAGLLGESLGYNLVGVADLVPQFTALGDQTGTSVVPLDPRLAPLAGNGGRVPTHAFDLSSGLSPAIDAGNAFGLSLDARGLARTVDFLIVANAAGGDGTDIGAFELQAPTAALVVIEGRVLTAEGQPLHRAVVTLTGRDGWEVSTVTDTGGYFRFDGVSGGEGYVLSVARKRYRFGPVFVNADADVAGLDIYAR